MRSYLRWLIVSCLVVWSLLAVGANELHDAAQKGDSTAVKRLLESGVPIESTDRAGETALYRAAKAGQVEIVRQLLAAGANPRLPKVGVNGPEGTALHRAVREGHVEAARVLLEAGVDPNLDDRGIGPPLHVAIWWRQVASEKLLRSYGARRQFAEPVDSLLSTADLSLGKTVSYVCNYCHDLMEQSRGPALWGVVGRQKAAVSGFEYSEALRKLGGNWTYADLNNFLANPRGFAPGTKDSFPGIEDKDRRAALIAYLRTLSDAPKPLP